jgi:hypothetical protein
MIGNSMRVIPTSTRRAGKFVEVGDETERASRFVKKGSGDEIRSTSPPSLHRVERDA